MSVEQIFDAWLFLSWDGAYVQKFRWEGIGGTLNSSRCHNYGHKMSARVTNFSCAFHFKPSWVDAKSCEKNCIAKIYVLMMKLNLLFVFQDTNELFSLLHLFCDYCISLLYFSVTTVSQEKML